MYNLLHDIKVFGLQVKSFPAGIAEAFGELIKKTGDCAGARSYYGIGYMTPDGQIIYKAAALEKYEDEAEKYNCERYTIEKGEYVTITLYGWQKKTDCIKDLFHELMRDNRVDKTKPCVEWYKDDNEMMCMIQTDSEKRISPNKFLLKNRL